MAMAEHGSSCWSKTEEWLRVVPNELALGGELGPNPKSNKYEMTVVGNINLLILANSQNKEEKQK